MMQKVFSSKRRLALVGRAALLTGVCSAAPRFAAADPGVRAAILGDAILNNEGYTLLEKMTTRYGPRFPGTEGNTRSLDFLEEALQTLGMATHRERYAVPGWTRGEDTVALVSPPARALRATALAYLEPHEPVEAAVFFVEALDFDALVAADTRGKIALFRPNLRLSQSDYARLADEFGVVGGLLINRVNGGQVLARTASHKGIPPPFPVFSITVEEGRWIERQLEDGMQPRVRLETRSRPVSLEVENLVAVLPGRSGEKIVLGGHFDSWDLGQGAIDNGLGVAQLFEAARLLQAYSPENAHTVEIVWFNAEEWGLWGSKDYVERHDLSSVRAMLNLDMVGDPIALNAMGFDHLVPFLEGFSKNLGGWEFSRQVANKPWLGSDHHPFILKGVPAITFNAPLAPEDVRFYHDFGDTFDKVDPAMLARGSALVALLTYDLANDTETPLTQLDEAATAKLFQDAGLEDRMRKAGQWPFGDLPPATDKKAAD